MVLRYEETIFFVVCAVVVVGKEGFEAKGLDSLDRTLNLLHRENTDMMVFSRKYFPTSGRFLTDYNTETLHHRAV